MKKKLYTELDRVNEFFTVQSESINSEYNVIINILEKTGRLTAPLGEKVNKTLFAIRIIRTGNVRVFYVYGKENNVYGIHGYIKKTREIPKKELNIASKIVKELKREKLI